MLTSAISALAGILILALAVVALTRGTDAVLGLRARTLRRGVAGLLAEARGYLARQTGESGVEIRARSRHDARRLLMTALGRPATWVERSGLSTAVEAKIPDLAGHAAALERRFAEVEPVLSKRFCFDIRLCALAWSLLLVATFQVWLPGRGVPASSMRWLSGIDFTGSALADLLSVLLTAVLVTLTASPCYRMLRGVFGDLRTQPEPPPEVPEDRGTIGNKNGSSIGYGWRPGSPGSASSWRRFTRLASGSSTRSPPMPTRSTPTTRWSRSEHRGSIRASGPTESRRWRRSRVLPGCTTTCSS